MALKITFSDKTTKTYTDSVHYAIGDVGTLTITDGDDVRIYAPHAWTLIETSTDAPFAGTFL